MCRPRRAVRKGEAAPIALCTLGTSGHRGGDGDLTPKLGSMPQIINGGKWAENRLQHLRQLLEQTTDEDERRRIEHEIEQLKPEASLRRKLVRLFVPGMK